MSSGPAGCRDLLLLQMLLPELESQHKEKRSECNGIPAKPPGQNNGSDDRRNDECKTKQDRNNTGQYHPSSPVLSPELERCSNHQTACHQGPGRDHEDEREDSAYREEEGNDAEHDVEDALGEEQPLPFMLLDR